jgi:hypothetical protein
MSDPVLPVTVTLKVIAVTEVERHGVNQLILPFLFSLVARELRILEDFAESAGDLMILSGISSGWET